MVCVDTVECPVGDGVGKYSNTRGKGHGRPSEATEAIKRSPRVIERYGKANLGDGATVTPPADEMSEREDAITELGGFFGKKIVRFQDKVADLSA